MKTKTILAAAFVLVILASGRIAAQSVSFAYDLAGNRIQRIITLNTPNRAPRANNGDTDETETPPFVEQLTPDLQVKIYPNPTKGLLQVEITGNANDEDTQIAVFGQSGQQIFTGKASETRTPVDLSAYPAGVYILRLTINNKAENYTIIKK